MFFAAKYRKRGAAQSGRRGRHKPEYVLEISSAAQMSSATFKFDANSPAAEKFKNAVFEKIKELWDSSLQDDAVAQYALALVARATDSQKLEANLAGILGPATAPDLCKWILKYVRLHREELLQSKAPPKPGTKKKVVSQAPTQASAVEEAKPADLPEPQPEPAAKPEQENEQDVEDLLRENGQEDSQYVEENAETTEAVQQPVEPAAEPAPSAPAAPEPAAASGHARVEWVAQEPPKEDDRRPRESHAHGRGLEQRDRVRGRERDSKERDGKERDRRSEHDRSRERDRGRHDWERPERERLDREREHGRMEGDRSDRAIRSSRDRDLERDRSGREREREQDRDGGRHAGDRLRTDRGQERLDADLERRTRRGGSEDMPRSAPARPRSRSRSPVASPTEEPSRSRLRSAVVTREATKRPAAATLFSKAIGSVAGTESRATSSRPAADHQASARQQSTKTDREEVLDRSTGAKHAEHRRASEEAGRPVAKSSPEAVPAPKKSVFERLGKVATPLKRAAEDDDELAAARRSPAADDAAPSPSKQQRRSLPEQQAGPGPVAGGRGRGPGPRLAKQAVPTASAANGAFAGPEAAAPPARGPVTIVVVPNKPAAAAPATEGTDAAAAAELQQLKLLQMKAKMKQMEAELARASANTRSVVVQNLHFAATEEIVIGHFSRCGMVRRVTILRDMVGKPRGACYIEFADIAAARAALSLNLSSILGRPIMVKDKGAPAAAPLLGPAAAFQAPIPQLPVSAPALVPRPVVGGRGPGPGPKPRNAAAAAQATAPKATGVNGACAADAAAAIARQGLLSRPLSTHKVWMRSEPASAPSAAHAGQDKA